MSGQARPTKKTSHLRLESRSTSEHLRASEHEPTEHQVISGHIRSCEVPRKPSEFLLKSAEAVEPVAQEKGAPPAEVKDPEGPGLLKMFIRLESECVRIRQNTPEYVRISSSPSHPKRPAWKSRRLLRDFGGVALSSKLLADLGSW